MLRLEEVDHVKQELVSNVSHELRTPITSIAGYAELLSDGMLGELTEGQVDAMERIERNTTRLGLLVEDLLTLSKAESGQLDFARERGRPARRRPRGLELLEELVRVRDDRPADRAARRAGGDPGRRACPRAGGDEPDQQRHQVHARQRSGHRRR